ncbi:MAG: hypothetical protein E5X76_32755 [Mesorhizobium sp.]|nr:MAG: hypothetical protein E5X76_32755 [Mesorhizobium sp.]
MRSIAQGKRQVAANKKKNMPAAGETALVGLSTSARQEDITYASQIVRRLSRSRDGRMLVRLGKGEMLREVGARRGITHERVRQLTAQARERLVKAVA